MLELRQDATIRKGGLERTEISGSIWPRFPEPFFVGRRRNRASRAVRGREKQHGESFPASTGQRGGKFVNVHRFEDAGKDNEEMALKI